ncbi:uncharacterized protein BDZ99DRAFT_519518 [Mytilinidion resinicola]|uniref:Gfd2/YDR514C-like C-terminal domain-containing protein n=1 Tax=Mytilinidion resinicola TaxID=574789 RepID=A0A6A6YQ06_9PEZI|nr:uncharacterized protein BDZ99DRAFT_519518 [Mytilinidion resinicola]KAF2810841.1 hypothetical protein BDZ99DRAFT_519518 [Mytilinidion resinicola]
MATAVRAPAVPRIFPAVPKLVPAVPRILPKTCSATVPGKNQESSDDSGSSTLDAQSALSANDSQSSSSSRLPADEPSLLGQNCKFPQLRKRMIDFTDTEAIQHALGIHSTEQGVSDIVIFLDTRDLYTLKDGPGANADNLMKQVQFHHYRIKEHGHMKNKHYIGHPERFEWGTTMWVSKEEMKDTIVKYFTPRTDEADKESDLRPVLFLGHALGNDEKELKKGLGLDLADLGTIVKSVDT